MNCDQLFDAWPIVFQPSNLWLILLYAVGCLFVAGVTTLVTRQNAVLNMIAMGVASICVFLVVFVFYIAATISILKLFASVSCQFQ